MKLHSSVERTLLILRGVDRTGFLHRLSTNHLEDMQAGCFSNTVFTDSNARIIDMGIVGNMQDMTFFIGHGNNKERLWNHLTSRKLLDDVQITDSTELNDFYLLSSPIAGDIIGSREGATLVADGPFTLAVISKNVDHSPLLKDSKEDANAIERLRIENLHPGPAELCIDYTPLNVGLGHLVHENKGCYLGQEILARMRSRGRSGKQLTIIEGEGLETGVDGVTSWVEDIGLAVQRINP
ncbi:MAG: hypothetical protein QF707_01770 [Candidatus Poseidoniaceae archaeon]|jgi:folate-binding protein YgfZ|nr:hypothetical protein [Candidatus Poseidoniaceae archaeon]MDP7203063.1 hypothetical protein [Candidatus Poseidoniaceae archaeon]